MTLFLVRHGEALAEDVDTARPLSEAGRKEAELMAAFLSEIRVDEIRHSTKLRAKQTAEAFGARLGLKAAEAEGLSPMDDPSIWAAKLKLHTKNLMLVGHLPHLDRLGSLLLCGTATGGHMEFDPGTVLCLESVGESWVLKYMISPWMIERKGLAV